jgi:hypothetical protein
MEGGGGFETRFGFVDRAFLGPQIEEASYNYFVAEQALKLDPSRPELIERWIHTRKAVDKIQRSIDIRKVILEFEILAGVGALVANFL